LETLTWCSGYDYEFYEPAAARYFGNHEGLQGYLDWTPVSLELNQNARGLKSRHTPGGRYYLTDDEMLGPFDANFLSPGGFTAQIRTRLHAYWTKGDALLSEILQLKQTLQSGETNISEH
jgi:hypothetical protein